MLDVIASDRSIFRDWRRPIMAVALLAVMHAVGCSTAPSMVLDTDVPAVPGLESTYARGLDRRDGALVSGRIVYSGTVTDGGALARRMISLFSAAGWTVASREQMDHSERIDFAKGDRRCELLILPNRIDPAMSSAQMFLRLESADTPA